MNMFNENLSEECIELFKFLLINNEYEKKSSILNLKCQNYYIKIFQSDYIYISFLNNFNIHLSRTTIILENWYTKALPPEYHKYYSGRDLLIKRLEKIDDIPC